MSRRSGPGQPAASEHAASGGVGARQSVARVRDLRLWAGVVLLALSVLAGALVLGDDDQSVTVWRATSDLSAGSRPTGLEATQISPSVAGDRYVRPGDLVDGVLRWPVAAGELLPRGALGDPAREPTRRVTVPVDPLHAPVGVQAGDVVDAWVMPRSDAGLPAQARPDLVLSGALVARVTEDALGMGGEVGVVLEVPAARVPDLVAATRRGVVDLVAVPLASQEVVS